MKNSIDFAEVNKMIKEITTGSLGKKLNDKKYLFINDKLLLYYDINNIDSNYDSIQKNYRVYYNGSLMYNAKDNVIECLNYNFTWVKEIYVAYKGHLIEEKEQEYRMQREQFNSIKSKKVEKIFGLVDPTGYIDNKIMIDHIEHYIIPAPNGDYSKNEELFNGRIKFLDGTIVVDTQQDIYHPGAWEDYVCYLVDTLELRKKYEQQFKKQVFEEQTKQEEYEQKRIKELKHTPIDDRRFFR